MHRATIFKKPLNINYKLVYVKKLQHVHINISNFKELRKERIDWSSIFKHTRVLQAGSRSITFLLLASLLDKPLIQNPYYVLYIMSHKYQHFHLPKLTCSCHMICSTGPRDIRGIIRMSFGPSFHPYEIYIATINQYSVCSTNLEYIKED